MTILNHPFPINSNQIVTIERIPKGDTISMHSPLLSPILISQNIISITSDTIWIDLPQYIDGDSYYISINSTLLANTEDIKPKIAVPKIYPNPVNDILNIEYPYSSNWNLEVWTLSGLKIANFKDVTNQISLKEMNSGLYILRFRDSNSQVYTLKLFKKIMHSPGKKNMKSLFRNAR